MAVSFIKSSKKKEEDDWISISDMMAVLMVVFLFIAIVYMQQVLEQSKIIEVIESKIYKSLNEEFKEDFGLNWLDFDIFSSSYGRIKQIHINR